MTKDTKMKEVTPDKPYSECPEEPKEYYPHFRLKLEDIPEAKGWSIGEKYILLIGVEQVAIREDKKGGEVTFDVKKVKAIGRNPCKKEK